MAQNTTSSTKYHSLSLDALLAAPGIESTPIGLTSLEAKRRLETNGPNQLAEAPRTPTWRRLLAQFQDLVIWILIVAAVLAGVMGEWADTAAILAIVLINGIIGFIQEEKAGRALAALQKLSAPTAKVMRDGKVSLVPAHELVVGDRLELEAGDHVAADARLLGGFAIRIQEAALTGESEPVDKVPDAVVPEQASLADRSNMGYMGTILANGKASAIVVATGMQTELGQIAGLLDRSPRETTPLQRRLAELGRVLIIVCLALVSIIFTLEWLRGGRLIDVLLISVSLAVAAVPEGLPAVVTMTLAIGLQRMVQRNAIVRKLPSVETLGSVTVICSDKTGTLTRNEMTVCEVVQREHRYRVTGGGYEPRGSFIPIQDQPSKAIVPQDDPDLMRLLTTASICNSSKLTPPSHENSAWQIIGDPTEGALLVVATKAGIALEDAPQILMEFPFDSDRKSMTVVVRHAQGQVRMYSKGAPEVILSQCDQEASNSQIIPLEATRRQAIMQDNSEMASRALRVLGLAYRDFPATDQPVIFQEEHLCFLGLVGMIDPPRDEVRTAVEKCRAAGIRPIMITGDHPQTASAIAQQLQIADGQHPAITGNELDLLSDVELQGKVEHASVYARVSAEHKLRVVNALKAKQQVVAMTGDGVNDAPAVKAADIGIAMGITGTDVTKEASDMVLADDNFASIVNAIEEGRGIFDNIQKSIHYLLACNAGEVLLMLLATLLGWPVPLIAIQILWINLVTDGLPALALGMEPPERDVMTRKPRSRHESVITWRRGLGIVLHGGMVASVALIGFWLVYQGDPERLARARTTTFCIMAFTQLFFAIGCRSQRFTMPELGFWSNPHLLLAILLSGLLQLSVVMLPFAQPIFEVASHLTWEWWLILGLSLAPVTMVESHKLLRSFMRHLQPD